MKTETFTKSEVLHHFEVLMPKDKKSKAKYISAPNFISACTKLGLIIPLGKGLYVYPDKVSEQNVFDLIDALKAYNKKRNAKKPNKKKQSTDLIESLDEMAKKVAASGLYRIENGKVFKQVLTWVEL